jgi:hypothetical protein
MPPASAIRKVAFLGDYLPRKCGIATFTTDLRCAVAAQFPAMQCLVVPVNDIAGGYDYPAEVRFEIAEQDLPSYEGFRPDYLHGKAGGINRVSLRPDPGLISFAPSAYLNSCNSRHNLCAGVSKPPVHSAFAGLRRGKPRFNLPDPK